VGGERRLKEKGREREGKILTHPLHIVPLPASEERKREREGSAGGRETEGREGANRPGLFLPFSSFSARSIRRSSRRREEGGKTLWGRKKKEGFLSFASSYNPQQREREKSTEKRKRKRINRSVGRRASISPFCTLSMSAATDALKGRKKGDFGWGRKKGGRGTGRDL